VDGKEISMGTLNWSYDSMSHALRNESSSATFQLFVDGNKIDGNLTLPDKTVYRRIHLEKKIEIARSCRRFRTCQLVAGYCAGAFTTLGTILSMV
jgi:hypothetical protein